MMIARDNNLKMESASEEETWRIGMQLAAVLQNRDLVVLSGPLGAGKTIFIKGLAAGLGIDREYIGSPSYTLVNEYFGKFPLFHFDLYRLENESELYFIGWDEYLLRDGVMVVEWGEKAAGLLPGKRIEVDIAIIDEHSRRLNIRFLPGAC